jgi:Tol biopolymer transport system component
VVTLLLRAMLVLTTLFAGVFSLFARGAHPASFPTDYYLTYRYTAANAIWTSIIRLDSPSPKQYSHRAVHVAFPTCSPDGQYLAYISNGRLHLVSAKGWQSAPLPFVGTVIDEISLSNRGDVVVSLANMDNVYLIYQMFSADFSTGQLSELPMEYSSLPLSPALAPDGAQVAYRIVERQNRRAAQVTVATTGTLTELYAMRGAVSPAWSPNGAMIAFVRREGEHQQLFLKDVRMGAEVQVTFDDTTKASPVWSPDGQHLLFVRPGGAYLMAWDGHEHSLIQLPEQIADFALESACFLTFRPDMPAGLES